MSAVVLAHVRKIDLPAEPGLSTRAARAVLSVYARLCKPDGSFRFGIRGSKIAELADYSIATIRRAQRFLTEQGYLVKIEVGGGRRSTRWLLDLQRLGFSSSPRDTTPQSPTPQPPEPDTAQEHRPKTFEKPSSRGPAGMSPPVLETCTHGGDASTLPDGSPRCAICRRQRTTQNNDGPPAPARRKRFAGR